MIQSFEGTLYQSPESRMKKKWFTEDSYLALVCASQPSLALSLTLTIHTFQVIKGKEKKTDYIFVHYCLFLYTIQIQIRVYMDDVTVTSSVHKS